jgi:hypothetical protein
VRSTKVIAFPDSGHTSRLATPRASRPRDWPTSERNPRPSSGAGSSGNGSSSGTDSGVNDASGVTGI